MLVITGMASSLSSGSITSIVRQAVQLIKSPSASGVTVSLACSVRRRGRKQILFIRTDHAEVLHGNDGEAWNTCFEISLLADPHPLRIWADEGDPAQL